MILRIFIAIMMLNVSHMRGAVVLHLENDPLLARKARTNAEAERVTSASWSVWSVVSSAYNMVTHIVPTPEEVLRERLKGIVFPDGRDAAGELVLGYRLPPVTEVVVDQADGLSITIMGLGDTMSTTKDPLVYSTALRTIVGCASKGNTHALSTLAWIFASGDRSIYKTLWPYINAERAALFRESEERIRLNNNENTIKYDVLRKLLEHGRYGYADKKRK